MHKNQYNYGLDAYKRIQTREVNIGKVALGADNPIRIQSMTTTDTMDTDATVAQTIRMVESGCEYVRITAPSILHAKNLKNIKDQLRAKGYDVPLIADIHFTPNAAEEAARIVEKVRVNPGNYVDKKKFQQIEYTDAEYSEEIERIQDRFSPLVNICKDYGTAMRIGTNHGSLSDRIMSRYGDTAEGMVESALEFVRICEDLNYFNIVLSMKSSNTQVMVQAYRLLMHEMMKREMIYPVHLGVTEAGEGEDGRLKSAVGIGSLLVDGIGDTVRVSLTEDPEFEAPVARYIIEQCTDLKTEQSEKEIHCTDSDPFAYRRRKTEAVGVVGGENVPVVISGHSKADFEEVSIEDQSKFHVIELQEVADIYKIKKQVIGFNKKNDKKPIILDLRRLTINKGKDITAEAQYQLSLACSTGLLLIDGVVDGLWVDDKEASVLSGLSLLQAARLRTVKTEFISCPSCGRTLFDLQETTAKVRDVTGHLKGLKIAVMGCIVNGPGEMADADYGYVGSGVGTITLYRGQNVVHKNIEAQYAVQELIEIIKNDGRWVDKI